MLHKVNHGGRIYFDTRNKNDDIQEKNIHHHRVKKIGTEQIIISFHFNFHCCHAR